MERALYADSAVVTAKDQVSSDLGDEVAILDLKSGTYYGLDAVGTQAWSLIQKPRTVEEIQDILVSKFEIEPDRCARDLVALLQRPAKEGLIEVRDEPSA